MGQKVEDRIRGYFQWRSYLLQRLEWQILMSVYFQRHAPGNVAINPADVHPVTMANTFFRIALGRMEQVRPYIETPHLYAWPATTSTIVLAIPQKDLQLRPDYLRT